MKKRLIGTAVAALLLIAGLSVYVALLDVNQYKDQLTELVEASTGRALSISGDIRLKLSLVPTVAVDGVTFGNAAWAAHENMITVERFEARLALLPLLRAELAFKRLIVVGARISIESDRKGRGNWVLDLEDPGRESGPPSSLPRFDLDELEIRHTVLEYRPYGGTVSTVTINDLVLRTEGFGQPLKLEVDAAYEETPIELRGRISPIRRLFGNEPYALDLTGTVKDIEFSIEGDVQEPLDGRGMRLKVAVVAPDLAALVAPLGFELPQRGPVGLNAVLSDTRKTYVLEDVEIRVAESRIGAAFNLEQTSSRWRINGDVDAATVVAADFGIGSDGGIGGERIFSLEPLALDWLDVVEGRIDLTIDNFVSDHALITGLTTALVFNNRVLEIGPVVAKIGDGALNAAMEIDAAGETPGLKLNLEIATMALGSLPKLAEGGRVSGGSTDLALSLVGNGNSVAAMMASANGLFSIDTNAATIHNDAAGVAGSDLVKMLFSLLNPMSAADTSTALECAVIRFPIADGVARNPTGIGVQTQKLTIVGGGTLDLRTEALDIGAKPKPREGIGINLSSLVDFVRLGGTLAHPRVATDAKGVTTAGLKVGAAVATGGLSLLAEGLFDRATAGADVCAIARGEESLEASEDQGKKDPSTFESATSKTKSALEDAGAKVKGVFKGLFGK